MASFDSFREWNSHVETAKSDADLNRELSLLHVNVRSLNKYWDELGLILKTAAVPFYFELNIDVSKNVHLSWLSILNMRCAVKIVKEAVLWCS